MSTQRRRQIVDEVRDVINEVEDPEMPVMIGELGMVQHIEVLMPSTSNGSAAAAGIKVTLRPTFLGCPARFLIEADVRDAVSDLFDSPVVVSVAWDSAAAWQPSDVSPSGREKLRLHGVALDLDGEPTVCPYCGADQLEVMAERGVALCRRLASCRTCRSSVDIMGIARGPQRLADLAADGGGGCGVGGTHADNTLLPWPGGLGR